MPRHYWRHCRFALVMVAFGLLLAACGGSGELSPPDGLLATVLIATMLV